jgi:hypothetical protein
MTRGDILDKPLMLLFDCKKAPRAKWWNAH